MEKQRNLRFQYKRRRVRKEHHNVLFVCLFDGCSTLDYWTCDEKGWYWLS
jgi:hypothetical protein